MYRIPKIGELWKDERDYMLITGLRIADPVYSDWVYYEFIGEDNIIKHGCTLEWFSKHNEYVSG